MQQSNNPLATARTKKIARKFLRHFVLQIILIAIALLYLFPFVWMISTALKTESEFLQNSMSLWVKDPQWYNFIKVTQIIPFFRYLGNTLIIVAGTVVGTVLSCSLVSFSFGKLYWPGKNIAFLVLLSTMMLPSQVLQIPTFVLFSKMHWLDTFLPLIVPAFFGGGAFNIYLSREFYRGIPNELMHAAKIDGCNFLQIWWKIMFPLCMPITLTIVIFTFMSSWNDYMGPLLYINIPDMYPLSLGLRAFQQQYQTQWDMMMSGAILSMLPTLVIYFVFQKYFMEGLAVTSGSKN